MKLKIQRIDENAIMPTYGTEYSAGADLYSVEEMKIKPQESAMIRTGIKMEIPTGNVGLIYARSGLATKKGLAPANKVGVIDSDYRGEIKVCLYNQSHEEQTVEKGERIAQIVITPYIKAEFTEVDELCETVRGEGGFGSTGSK